MLIIMGPKKVINNQINPKTIGHKPNSKECQMPKACHDPFLLILSIYMWLMNKINTKDHLVMNQLSGFKKSLKHEEASREESRRLNLIK